MKTAVVTDGRYRSSLAAVRGLGEAGYRVVVTQTRGDAACPPASFSSRFTAESRWIEGSCKDKDYGDRLLQVLREYDRPVLFCTGAVTLGLVSREAERFREAADFLVSPPEILDRVNDKQEVHDTAAALGLPVPQEYHGLPEKFPVVVKPHCGEKVGLKARDRYAIAEDQPELDGILAKMRQYDPDPIVQEKVTGPGEGVDLLMGREGELLAAMCHRRIREFPVTGGPSTCCVSFYDEKMILAAHRLLREMHFTGMAMVEFKGGRILEVNPRVWGSFPMTEVCGCPIAALYAKAASGEEAAYAPKNYREGAKMRFLFNDGMAVLDCLRHGRLKLAAQGMADFFRVPEALYRKDDKQAYRTYLKNSLKDR